MTNIQRLLMIAATISTAGLTGLFAQGTPASTANTPPDTELALHHLFLHNSAILHRKAGEMDVTGSAGAGLRNAFAAKLGLNGRDSAALLSLAARLDSQVTALDQQASAMIANIRSQHKPGTLLPPIPQDLINLERARTALVRAAMDSLPTALSPAGYGALEKYLHAAPASAAGVTLP